MKRLNIILITAIIFILVNNLAAQNQPPKVIIMTVPQTIFKHGIRLDIELPSKDYKAWWVISPRYYINVSELGNNNDYEQLHGYGLSLYRKGFLSRKNVDKGTYISGGIGLEHFNILANSERWIQINENGLNYMQLVKDNYNLNINKILTEAVIGYQKEVASRLYFDIYAGVGLRYSFYDQPSGTNLKFNKNISDYGYTGTAFIAGFKVGVGL